MSGEYRCIVVDPPWAQPSGGPASGDGFAVSGGRPSTLPYPTLTRPEIAALPVPDLADRDAHLYLWVTNHFLEDAYGIVRGWGFTPSTLLTWCKKPRGIGLGGAFTQTTEHALFARRGRPLTLQRLDSTWFLASRGEHSAKPEAFLDRVEAVSPGPRLEMFARRNRLGWDTWGNEALCHVSLSAATAAPDEA